MRLINVHNLKIENFRSAVDAPVYAVLSHTWGDAEPTITEWNSKLTRLRKAKQPGFAKILASCKQARRDAIPYLWADTVCIDKSSSAELSEAINSMFVWYQRSKICYAYLVDVPNNPPDETDLLDLFQRSRWFTRGWTLQELLAPEHVVFFTQSWTVLGTRNALASTIATVTGIDHRCLTNQIKLRNCSIAQRMSWAANRSTTREEDIAYSLLGIFSINMPLLYGEGLSAFRRLQEEIIKAYDDQSILAFDTALSLRNSVLADHPNSFRHARQIQPNFAPRITPPFSMTNAGLAIRTPLIQTLSPLWVLAVLNCIEVHPKGGYQKSQICLPLFGKDGTYMRARAPVYLFRKALTDKEPGLTSEIGDLTTTINTEYLISYFTRVYPVIGNELDPALNGFESDGNQPSGFMLTFPRGTAHWQLVEAYPNGALQSETSLFIPTVPQTGQSFPHGLIVFQNDTLVPPGRIGIYLAHTMHTGESGDNWMCRIATVPEQAEELYTLCNQEWPFEETHAKWNHYHRLEQFVVAARTRFSYGKFERHVVMVEIVFDYDALLCERGLL